MGVLDQIMELKNMGMGDEEIINNLKERGISLSVINDALNQARIKSAVSAEGEIPNDMEPSIMRPEKAESLPTEGIISDEDLVPPPPSKIQAKNRFVPMTQNVQDEDAYIPRPQETYQEPQYEQQAYQPYPYQDHQENQMPQYQAYQTTDYGQQGYEYPIQNPGITTDTDTIIEIAEQVFSEKVKFLQKQIEDLNEFKILSQTKIENISERLKRIESNIDNLQAEILEKVGSYGRGLDGVKKEIEMMQDSFGKMVGALESEAEHPHPHKHTTTHHHKLKKKK